MKKKVRIAVVVMLATAIATGCGGQSPTSRVLTNNPNNQSSVNAVLQQQIDKANTSKTEDTSIVSSSSVEDDSQTNVSVDLPKENDSTSSEPTVDAQSSVEMAGSTDKIPEPDYDLADLDSAIMIGELNTICANYIDNIGSVIRISGEYYEIPSEIEGLVYYTCILSWDSTGCCPAAMMEFVLKEGETYPEIYDEIVVQGRFETYWENDLEYVHLVDATLIKN